MGDHNPRPLPRAPPCPTQSNPPRPAGAPVGSRGDAQAEIGAGRSPQCAIALVSLARTAARASPLYHCRAWLWSEIVHERAVVGFAACRPLYERAPSCCAGRVINAASPCERCMDWTWLCWEIPHEGALADLVWSDPNPTHLVRRQPHGAGPPPRHSGCACATRLCCWLHPALLVASCIVGCITTHERSRAKGRHRLG